MITSLRGRMRAGLLVTAAAAGVSLAGVPGLAAAAPAAVRQIAACPASAGGARCFAVVDEVSGHSTRLEPFGPADLRSAYALPSTTAGSGQTVAIVDAYDDPNAERDLAAYRRHFHETPCTGASGCFRKVDQRGGKSLPQADAGWALEESLDLDMVSAICPNCSILLVEADDNETDSLYAAEDTAVRLGAHIVSNSYGGPESADEAAQFAQHFAAPGVVYTVSTGDDGFGVQQPAAAPNAVAVGGTSLYADQPGARGWREAAWAGAGSGCSAYVPKQSWQTDPLCHHRTLADVSAVADPDTPVAVYDTYGFGGFVAVGGTSVAAPLVAGVFALAGNAASISAGPYLYSHAADLYDATGGSNGSCGRSYLCRGVRGYDGPTGLGTPHGIGAF